MEREGEECKFVEVNIQFGCACDDLTFLACLMAIMAILLAIIVICLI